MKNAFKLGLLVVGIGAFATGCFGCGDGDRGHKPGVDPDSTVHQKPDTARKAGIDTAKKDTTKK